jgi:ubiquinone/menaquinone biosynthesis C-methylase UbiE
MHDFKIIEEPDLFKNARNPQGELGEELLGRMNEFHENLAQWGIKHLDISKSDIILDIGCGGGVNVKRFLNMTENRVYGVDYSQLAVEKSIELNQNAIDECRCEIIHGSVSDLPFKDSAFDIATAFETVYFWPDFAEDLKEVRRVLKDNGILLICNEAIPKKDDERQKELIKLLDMKIYSQEELTQYLYDAGFSKVKSFLNEGPDSVQIKVQVGFLQSPKNNFHNSEYNAYPKSDS